MEEETPPRTGHDSTALQPQAREYSTRDYIRMWGLALLQGTLAVVALYIIHDLTHYVI